MHAEFENRINVHLSRYQFITANTYLNVFIWTRVAFAREFENMFAKPHATCQRITFRVHRAAFDP